jgi:hypothetical protein
MELLNVSGYKDVMCVYKIENMINGKVYIGSTTDLQDRVNNHIKNLTNSTHNNKQFQISWNATSDKSKFNFEIVELIDDDTFLPFAEIYYIEKYRRINGVYNISDPIQEIKVLRKRNKENKKNKSTTNNEYVVFKGLLDQEFSYLFEAMQEKLNKNQCISYKKVSVYIYEKTENKFEIDYFHKSLKSYIRNIVKGSVYNFESESYFDETLIKYNIPKRELTILNRDLGNEIGAYNTSIKEKL